MVPPPSLPSRSGSAVSQTSGPTVHKKAPPPPVKPKNFQRQGSYSQPADAIAHSAPVHNPSPAPAANQTGYGNVASQLGNAFGNSQTGSTGSFRDRLKSFNVGSTGGTSASSDQSSVNSAGVNAITSQLGHMAMNPGNQTAMKNTYQSYSAGGTDQGHVATSNFSNASPDQHSVNSAGVSAIASHLGQMAANPSNQTSIKNKVQALNQAQPNFASQIASRFNNVGQQQQQHQQQPQEYQSQVASPPPTAGHKKAPPPPPKKIHLTSGLPSAAAQPQHVQTAPANTPPPINFANRPPGYDNGAPAASFPALNVIPAPVPAPAAAVGTAPQPGQKEFDLQLHTQWFAAPINNVRLPITLSGLNYTLAATSSGNNHTLIIAVRITDDLSIVKYKLTWQANNPQGTVSVERKELPAPPALPQTQLIQAHEQFGNGVASWAEAMMSQQVGDGECWTLAKEAIDQSSHGYALPSQSYTHGALVYHATGGATAPLAYNDSIRRGDILQFTSGRFETRNAQGMVVASSTVGAPNHTSIVTSVSANNRVVDIVHQNVGGVKQVQKGTHNLDELTQGDLKIFRPVWKEWAGELSATW